MNGHFPDITYFDSLLSVRISVKEQRKHDLFIKQGAKDRYASKEERDKQIVKQIRDLERQIKSFDLILSLLGLIWRTAGRSRTASSACSARSTTRRASRTS